MVLKLTLTSINLRQFLLSAGKILAAIILLIISHFRSSSDEEGEDSSALLYLPIAPDIEEPEDGFIPEPDSGGSPKRDQVWQPFPLRRVCSGSMSLQENAGPSPAKKKRTKTTEIQLENAPQDEVHINRAINHWYSPRIICGFRWASRPDL